MVSFASFIAVEVSNISSPRVAQLLSRWSTVRCCERDECQQMMWRYFSLITHLTDPWRNLTGQGGNT